MVSEILFRKFLTGGDSLQIYEAGETIFISGKPRLLSLLEYITKFSSGHKQVTIFDKIMGNGAALLSVLADCREVYSPLGSQAAIATLDRYRINHYIMEVVPNILKSPDGGICPMEKLSLNKGPDEFYEALTVVISSRK